MFIFFPSLEGKMKKEIFKFLIYDFIERELADVKKRELELPLDINKIVTLVGIRRAGKTYLFYYLARKLREQFPRENIVYINFEDDRIFPLALTDMESLIQAYYELYPHKKDEIVYFLFDEIQNVPYWEKFVRRIYDSEKCRIYLSGSSSKLLSKEIATSLRGRTLTYEIFPLGFREFLLFKGVKYIPYSSKSLAEVKNFFNEYLWRGGFPEVVNYNQEIWRKTLQEYFNLIIYKDIVERYKVTNLSIVQYLAKNLIKNCSSLMSVNKIYNDLKSQGFQISKNTIYDYISFFEDAFIIFLLPIFSYSIRKEWRNPRKVYAIDIALKKIIDFQEDKGKIYENLVFLELRKKYQNLTYFKGKQEVDFYHHETKTLINVCTEYFNEQTKKREISGLKEAMEVLKIEESLLLTSDTEEEITIDGKKIIVLPIWKWVLHNV